MAKVTLTFEDGPNDTYSVTGSPSVQELTARVAKLGERLTPAEVNAANTMLLHFIVNKAKKQGFDLSLEGIVENISNVTRAQQSGLIV